MNSFFDDLKKNLTDKGMEAAQKAKDTAEILQLRAQIAGEKSQLDKLYGAIGALYYKKHRNDEGDEYATFFGEIGQTLVRIQKLKARIEELDGSRTCPNCGAVVRKGDTFCGKCGAQTPQGDAVWEPEKPEEEASVKAIGMIGDELAD